MNKMIRNKLLAFLTALAVLLTGLAGAARAGMSGLPQPGAVVTPPGPPAVRTAVFTIGSTTYTVDGQVYIMDTAPVLADGHALVPLRYLAYSLGIPKDGISYQSLEHLKAGMAAVNIQRRRSDGSPIDVTAFFSPTDPSLDLLAPRGLAGGVEQKFAATPRLAPSGRLLIPCRDLAQALGALVAWNPATRQVTVKTWETLPAVPPELSADQVAMNPGGDTITATYGGTPTGRETYPYPVDLPNPYYPGPGQNPDLYALIPTLEAFGVPAQNILWDPDSQTVAVAGNSPFQFIYFTVGTNINDNLTDELAIDLDPPDIGPSVSMVGNGVLYVDNTLILILAFGFNLQLTDQQGNSIDPILESGSVLTA